MARLKKDITESYKMPFPTALRALMHEKPTTTQEKLAEITGKTRQTVSQYVNGISEPGYDTLVKIADYFDVSVDYLLGRTKDRRKEPSVYDKIGLSEDSVSILRLSHQAMKSYGGVLSDDDSSMCELIQILEHHGHFEYLEQYKAFSPDETFPQEDKDNFQALMDAAKSGYAFTFSRSLANMVDDVIEAMVADQNLSRAYIDMTNPDRYPADTSGNNPNGDGDIDLRNRVLGSGNKLVTAQEFIRFKIYEISNSLNSHMVSKYVDGECGNGNN